MREPAAEPDRVDPDRSDADLAHLAEPESDLAAWEVEARRLVCDLFRRSPAIYWADFLLSAAGAWAATAVYLNAPTWSAMQVAAFLIAGVLFFRAGTFIHEIVHMPARQMPTFKRAWNLLIGVPMLMPWVLYRNHLGHHSHHTFGTPDDGEYLPLASSPLSELLKYLAQAPLLPLFMIVRFGILGPLSWLHPTLREWVLTRVSAAVSNPYYAKRFPERDEGHLKTVEALCFAWLLTLGALTWQGAIRPHHLFLVYLLLAWTLGLNWIRNLAAHRYANAGSRVSHSAQVEESINLVGQTWLTVLLFPVGLRYHALHHLFPALPYHRMGTAHRRLMQNLPPDSPYRAVNHTRFAEVVGEAVALRTGDVAGAVRHAQVVAGLRPALILTPPAPEAAPAAAEAAPAPPCLLVNPRSFRAARGLAERAMAVARSRGAEVVAVEDAAEVAVAVARIVARCQRHVAVLAGDGTVHAVVEQLARQPAGRFVPDLLVLPGGRTNLTAADLVPRRDALGTLARAFDGIAEGRWDAAVEERALLCVAQDPAPLHYGFFFGGAAIDRLVRLAQEHRDGGRGALRRGHLSSPWVVAKHGVRAVLGRTNLSSPQLEIDAEGLGRLGGEIRLLLATTLRHRGDAFDPYAARGQGELRLTAVTRAARFWPALPRLLTGRYSKAMIPANGYLSGRCERVRLLGLAGYVLDGERFDTDPARPVVLSAGPRLRFLTA